MGDFSVAEAAKIIGVSRARVYQRIVGYPKKTSGRPITSIVRETGRPGTKQGRQIRVPIAEVLQWRSERESSGFAVGELPNNVQIVNPYADMPPVGIGMVSVPVPS